MPMFDRARLRLTLWYLAALAAVVALLSSALYAVLLRLREAEANAVAHAITPVARRGIAALFARDKGTLAVEIVAIDLGVLVAAALGAYLLAGRTLQPIRAAMDRQRRFAAAASHELRTPLTVLQGAMEVALLRERAPAEYRKILEDAAAEAERMGALIADLLAVARAENDAAALALEPFDLREVARAAADGVRPLAGRKGQRLDVDLNTPLPVCGDRVKLRQALSNLLDNAVAYTPEGGAVRLWGYRERGQAVVAARDTGPGIEARHLPHLFEPFYRADAARGGEGGHAGLGLALASWIARAHGGRLDVESRVGVGSVFTLALPLDRRHIVSTVGHDDSETQASRALS